MPQQASHFLLNHFAGAGFLKVIITGYSFPVTGKGFFNRVISFLITIFLHFHSLHPEKIKLKKAIFFYIYFLNVKITITFIPILNDCSSILLGVNRVAFMKFNLSDLTSLVKIGDVFIYKKYFLPILTCN